VPPESIPPLFFLAMCVFCDVVAREVETEIVFEDENSLAFLDHRPIFPGHTLLVPKTHYETLADLPESLVAPFFLDVQLVSVAVETAMEAKGTFVAINNKISQSVPHLHTHIVPRRPKDGLRGFFWPRRKYKDDAEAEAAAGAIRSAVATMTAQA
jgi:histidine triad (HIT) family protein